MDTVAEMNVHGCTLDLHVDAAEVVQRVNGLLRWILEKIASHELPDINVVCRKRWENLLMNRIARDLAHC